MDDVPPRNGCPRVDGVLRVPSAGRWQPRWRREPVPSPGLLPPDEEYGRDGRTRCAAEIRSATNTLAQTSMIIRCFKTETSALLTPRAARRHGRCVRDAYRARAAASVVTPRRSPTYSSAQKAKPSTRNETRLSATMRRSHEASPTEARAGYRDGKGDGGKGWKKGSDGKKGGGGGKQTRWINSGGRRLPVVVGSLRLRSSVAVT